MAKAYQVLLLAKPQHGKTTRILEFLPSLISERTELLTTGVWPHLFDVEVPPRVDIFDPKGEVYAAVEGLSSDIHPHASATDAATAAYELGGRNGILILEEMLTLDSGDFKHIRKISALRRRDTSGEGIYIIGTSQRIYTTPLPLRALSNEIWFGRITEPRDLRGAVEVTADPSLFTKLPNMPVGQWVKKEL